MQSCEVRNMSDMCNDNRFELVAKYKAKLIESTNIETSADEMAVIDNILFRMWQMGWLDRLEQPTVDAVPVRCKDCKHCYAEGFVNVRNVCEKHYDFGNVGDDWFCADGERRTE